MVTKHGTYRYVVRHSLILAKNHMVTKHTIMCTWSYQQSYSSKKSYGNKTDDEVFTSDEKSYSSKKSYGNKT